MTLERLLLQTLIAEPVLLTPAYAASLWGADETLCHDWLKRFEKRGLCRKISLKELSGYAGVEPKILQYLESLPCPV